MATKTAGVETETAFVNPTKIETYHVHVYYDDATRATAERLRDAMRVRFGAIVGRWHDEAQGPHPVSMYQVAFAPGVFAEIVPWLMLNRDRLSILVHPETGDGYEDHAINALWLGPQIDLNLKFLKDIAERRKAAETAPV